MNKIDLREMLKRKLFEINQGGNEILRKIVINDVISNYTLEDVELILAKKKHLYYDIKTNEKVYLS